MAQKYVVKKADNPLTLAKKFEMSPQELLKTNGIKSLTAGQTIKVPTGGGGSFISGAGTVNVGQGNRPIQTGDPQPSVHAQVPVFGGRMQTTGGMLSPDKNPVITQPRYTSGSFYSGAGQVNTYGQGNMQASMQSNPVIAQSSTPARPQGVYTGDPNDPNTAQWKNYWNWQAANPNLVPKAAPVVMTRDQVWNMKAAQRRREGNGDVQETVSYQPYLQPVQPVYEPFYGNNVTQGSWRVGGG